MKMLLHKIFDPFTSGKIDWLNIPTAVYVRYILTILAAINTLIAVFGLAPINVDQSKLYDVISSVLFIVILLVNTYKDNPVSPEAIKSNKYMKELKAERGNNQSVDNPTDKSDK
jgi:SPP1 family holin